MTLIYLMILFTLYLIIIKNKFKPLISRGFFSLIKVHPTNIIKNKSRGSIYPL